MIAATQRRNAHVVSLMATPNLAAFFDPAWTDGLTVRHDSGAGKDYAASLTDRTQQHTVTQANTANQLELVQTNGRRTLSGAGTSQYLYGAAGLGALMSGNAPYWLVAITQYIGTGQRYFLSASKEVSGGSWAAHGESGSQPRWQRKPNGSALTSTSGGGTITTLLAHSQVYDGANLSAWRNTTVGIQNVALGATIDTNRFCIGALVNNVTPGGFWSGLIGGILVCTGTPAAGVREAAVVSMRALWGA